VQFRDNSPRAPSAAPGAVRSEGVSIVFYNVRTNPHRAGETVTFRVQDCFSGRVGPGTDPLESLRWTEINPATGPVAVRGARPGDTLVVDILEIRVAPRGVIVAAPGFGAVGHLLEDPEIVGLQLEGGVVRFGGLELAADPMIGVIGTAPAHGSVACGLPGSHGGNLNTGLVRAGVRVYGRPGPGCPPARRPAGGGDGQ